MKKYVTTQPVKLGPGAILGLSDDQVRHRGHLLKKLGNGRYQALAEVAFKAGEEIAAEGVMPKTLAPMFAPVQPEKSGK